MDEAKAPQEDSFYKPSYTLEEVADLSNQTMDDGLEDEIGAVRISIRRTLLKLEEELDPAEFARLTNLVFRGANTLAYLLKIRRTIRGDSADSIAGSIAQILLEIGEEKGWEL